MTRVIVNLSEVTWQRLCVEAADDNIKPVEEAAVLIAEALGHRAKKTVPETETDNFGRPGVFENWVPLPAYTCRYCQVKGKVVYRVWNSSDGGFSDTKYRCDSCDKIWWVDGPDS